MNNPNLPVMLMFGAIGIASEAFGIPVEEILSKNRKWEILEARQIAIYYIHTEIVKVVPITKTDTGILFGMDRTGISHAVKKIADALSVGDGIITEKYQRFLFYIQQ